MHDFVGLHRVGLPDAHEDEVVEDAFRRQRDVHDLGEVHLEDGQEEFHGRAADVEVFHRRDADDGGGINGVFAMRDGGDVENRIRLAPWNTSICSFQPGITHYFTGRGQRVIAGVVAERTFVAQRFGRIKVALDDAVGLPCRSLVRRQALDKTVFNSDKMFSCPQLNKLLSLLQSFHSVGPERFEPCEQRPVRTISFPNPDQGDRLVAQEPMVHKIFVLADYDGLVASGTFPNDRIVSGVESQVEDMRGLMTLAGNPSRQRGRELRINEEVDVLSFRQRP